MVKIFACVMLLVTWGFSKDISKIHWNTLSFPPGFIYEGPLKNQGYGDVLREVIIEALPKMKHTVELGSVRQAIINGTRMENACTAGLLKNDERQKLFTFSSPAFYVFPNKFTTLKKKSSLFAPFLTNNGEIDLEKLLQADTLRFGYVLKRAYGFHVDALVKEHASNKTSFARTGEDMSKGLLQMLSLNRIDYMLEYPSMVHYIHGKYELQDEFLQYSIKNASQLIPVYVACSKTITGEKLIEKMNRIIESKQSVFMEAYTNWLSPEMRNIYKAELEAKQ